MKMMGLGWHPAQVLLAGAALLWAAGCTTGVSPQPKPASNASLAPLVDPATPALSQLLAQFPAAAPGQTRWVIEVSAHTHEKPIRIELLPSIRMRADCNHILARAPVQEHTLAGWGYTYYVMGKVMEPMASTMMACPEETSQERDVPIQSHLDVLRHNGTTPIVFYTPNAVTLRYRLWKTHGVPTTAQPG